MAELYSIVLYRRHRDGLQCTEYVITMLIFSCFTYPHFEVYIYYIHKLSYFPFSKKMRVPLRLQPLLENCSAFTCNTLRRDNLGLVECWERNETATENLHCNQTVTQLL